MPDAATVQTGVTATNSATVSDSTGVLPLELPAAVDIYDAIMGQIELELVSTAIPGLEAKYRNETEDERKARAERYKKAYEEFDKQYQEWITHMKKLFADFKREAMKLAESKAKQQEATELANFDAQFSAALVEK